MCPMRGDTSMTILGADSLASGTTPAGPRTSLAVCASAVDTHRTAAASIRPMSECLMTGLLGSRGQRARHLIPGDGRLLRGPSAEEVDERGDHDLGASSISQ